MVNLLVKIDIKTNNDREVVDITDQISKLLRDQKIEAGFCHLFVKNTNAALTSTFLDPEEDLSVASVFEIVTPELTAPVPERYHRHVTPVSSLVVTSFLGQSLSLPFENNKLLLGEGQKVFLVELAGPRKHQIVIDCK